MKIKYIRFGKNKWGDSCEMEYIDVLDERGKFTGKITTREEVHKKGYWHKGIQVFIINSNRELLIQKRSANKKKHPNLWDISCAGHLSAGDTSVSGAIREMEEELGIRVSAKEIILIDTLVKSYIPKPGFFENEFQDVYLCFKDFTIQEITRQKDEVADVKYISFEDYKQLILTEDLNFVNRKRTHQEILEKIQEILNKEIIAI